MLGEPETEVDVGDLFGHAATPSADYYNVFEEEFETVFGAMGKFIIKKQIADLTKGQDITEENLPFIINKLSESVSDVVGPDASRELRKTLRRKCGLPV